MIDMSHTQKRISILIAADDLGSRLPILLRSLGDQTAPDWKAIVVDNSGSRSTVFEPPVYALRNPRPQTLARSMSQALELAGDSEYVLFCKSDLVFAPNFLETMLSEFRRDDSLVFAWPAFARASFDLESADRELVYGDERVLPTRSEDDQAACVMMRTQDLGSLRPDLRKSDDIVMQDLLWRLSQSGAKGRQILEAVAWLQPGATLASPSFFRYWTWVWTRRAPRS